MTPRVNQGHDRAGRAFSRLFSLPGRPECAQGPESGPKGAPKAARGGTKVHPKSMKNRPRAPWGCRGGPGVGTALKNDTQIDKQTMKSDRETDPKSENLWAFRPFFLMTRPLEARGGVQKKVQRDTAKQKHGEHSAIQ